MATNTLSETERAALVARAERVARVMDRLVGLPGSERGIGLDAIIGFVLPGVGDFATALVSLYIVWVGVRLRVPPIVLARMLLHIGLDELIGSIPVAGDVADAFYQSNLMNLRLLREHQLERPARKRDWLYVGGALLVAGIGVSLPLLLLLGLPLWWWLHRR